MWGYLLAKDNLFKQQKIVSRLKDVKIPIGRRIIEAADAY
jgi:hypothetical protein